MWFLLKMGNYISFQAVHWYWFTFGLYASLTSLKVLPTSNFVIHTAHLRRSRSCCGMILRWRKCLIDSWYLTLRLIMLILLWNLKWTKTICAVVGLFTFLCLVCLFVFFLSSAELFEIISAVKFKLFSCIQNLM